MISPLAPLACPLDGLPLEDRGVSWQCPDNHHYDLAKHGYLNLLPASQKTSKDPGDTKAMFAARRKVFASGLFLPVADALAMQLVSHVKTCIRRPAVVLDAGCGEGYYTEHMRAETAKLEHGNAPVHVGVDISKWGIAAAARAYPEVTWVVGNNKHLPVLTNAIDVITSIFGFETWKPWSQLQHLGQHVLVVHAGPMHLIELRELVYEKVTIHGVADDSEAIEAGYELVGQSMITSSGRVDSMDTVANILAMTPHGYRIPAARQAIVQAGLNELISKPLTIEVCCRWYERTGVDLAS